MENTTVNTTAKFLNFVSDETFSALLNGPSVTEVREGGECFSFSLPAQIGVRHQTRGDNTWTKYLPTNTGKSNIGSHTDKL